MKLHPPVLFIAIVIFLQHFCFVVSGSVPTVDNLKEEQQTYVNESISESPTTTESSTSSSTLSTLSNVKGDDSTVQGTFLATKLTRPSEEDEKISSNATTPPTIELTPSELLNLLSGKNDAPVILRPKEHEDIATILIPLTPEERDEVIRCPFCGKSQHVHLNHLTLRNEPCMHCNKCGHALRFLESSGVKKASRLVEKDPNATDNSSSTNPTVIPIEVASLNLTRKEILRRRLNHQRVHSYMKSIEPTSSNRQRSAFPIAAGYIPMDNFGFGLQSKNSFINKPNPSHQSAAINGRSSFWSWIFGNSSSEEATTTKPTDKPTEEKKPVTEIRSPFHYQKVRHTPTYNAAPQTSGWRCPYMTYQAQRRRK